MVWWAGGGYGVGAEEIREPVRAAPPLVERWLTDDYSVRVWGAADGLPAERITSLAESRDGYLWVGTAAGLARFDGMRFVH